MSKISALSFSLFFLHDQASSAKYAKKSREKRKKRVWRRKLRQLPPLPRRDSASESSPRPWRIPVRRRRRKRPQPKPWRSWKDQRRAGRPDLPARFSNAPFLIKLPCLPHPNRDPNDWARSDLGLFRPTFGIYAVPDRHRPTDDSPLFDLYLFRNGN